MQLIKGLLEEIKTHPKLNIRVSSDEHCGLPPSAKQRLLKPHRSANYFFLFVRQGRVDHTVDLSAHTVSTGQVLFVLPGQIHTPAAATGAVKYFKLSFDERCLCLLSQSFAFLLNPFGVPLIALDFATVSRVDTLFTTIDELMKSPGQRDDSTLVLAYLRALLVELDFFYFKNVRGNREIDGPLGTFLSFKGFLEVHLTECHSMRELAARLHVTPSALYRAVKQMAGVSPKQYMTNRLMLEAQRRLYYSELSVKELAYELGFSDPDYFSRLFKKSTGKRIGSYLAELRDLSGNS